MGGGQGSNREDGAGEWHRRAAWCVCPTRVTGVGIVLRASATTITMHPQSAINATRTEGRVGVAQLAVVVGEGRQLPHDQAHLRFLQQGAEGVGHTREQGHKKGCHKARAGSK